MSFSPQEDLSHRFGDEAVAGQITENSPAQPLHLKHRYVVVDNGNIGTIYHNNQMNKNMKIKNKVVNNPRLNKYNETQNLKNNTQGGPVILNYDYQNNLHAQQTIYNSQTGHHNNVRQSFGNAVAKPIYQTQFTISPNVDPNDIIPLETNQMPNYPKEHSRSKHKVLQHGQPIEFEDRSKLRFLSKSDLSSADKEITQPDKTTHNDVLITSANASFPNLEKIIQSPKNSTEIKYDTRFKCTLCGVDCIKKADAVKHRRENHADASQNKVFFQYKIPNKLTEENVKEAKHNEIKYQQELPNIASISGLSGNYFPHLNLNLSNVSNYRVNNLGQSKEDISKSSNGEAIMLSNSDFEMSENKHKILIQNANSTNHTNSHQEAQTIFFTMNNPAKTENQNKRKSQNDSNKSKQAKYCTDVVTLSNDDSTTNNQVPKGSTKHYSRKSIPKDKNQKDSDDSHEERTQADSLDAETGNIIEEFTKYLIKHKKVLRNPLLQPLKNKKDYDKRKPKEKIYKCNECSMHFISEGKLLKHLNKGNHNDKKKRCIICNLKFSKTIVKKHVKKHHIKMNLRLKDFDIVTELSSSESSDTDSSSTDTDDDTPPPDSQKSEPSTSNENKNKRINVKERVESRNECAKVHIPTDNTQHSQNPTIPETVQPSPNKIDENINPTLSKCEICDIYFVNHWTWYTHMKANEHNPKTKTQCPKCGLFFTEKSLRKHIDLHHEETADNFIPIEIITNHDKKLMPHTTMNKVLENKSQIGLKLKRTAKKMNLQVKDFNKIELRSTESIDTYSPSTNNDDDTSTNSNSQKSEPLILNENQYKRIDDKERVEFRKENLKIHISTDSIKQTQNLTISKTVQPSPNKLDENMKPTLYKCEICDIYFVNHWTWTGHMNTNEHDPKTKTQCNLCGLFFTKKSLLRHIDLHHDEAEDNSMPSEIITKQQNLLSETSIRNKVYKYVPQSGSKLKLDPKKMNIQVKDFDKVTELRSTESIDTDSSSIDNDDDTSPPLNSQITEQSMLNAKQNEEINEKRRVESHDECSKGKKSSDNIQHSQNLTIPQTAKPSLDKLDESLNPTLYKCEICDICFVNNTTWIGHMNANEHYPKTKTQCRLCGLFFTRKSLITHINIHHDETTDNSMPLQIITNYDKNLLPQTTIKKKVLENVPQVGTKLKHSSKKTIERNIKTPKKVKSNWYQKKHWSPESYSETIYKCRICKVYFLSHTSLLRHMFVGRHDTKMVKYCSICTLPFYNIIMDRHVDIHHKQLKLKHKNDFQVNFLQKLEKNAKTKGNQNSQKEAVVDGTKHNKQNFTEEKVNHNKINHHTKNNRITRTQRRNQDQKGLIVKADIPKSVSDLSHVDNRLYKCTRCDVHYIHKQALMWHNAPERHDIKKRYPCPICRRHDRHYAFSLITLKRHISIQHKQLGIKNFTVVNDLEDMPLKECDVRLTDLQSVLVTTTSDAASLAKTEKLQLYQLQPEQLAMQVEANQNILNFQKKPQVGYNNVDSDHDDTHAEAPDTNNDKNDKDIGAHISDSCSPSAKIREVINSHKNGETLQAEFNTINEHDIKNFETYICKMQEDNTEKNSDGANIQNTVIVHSMKTLTDALIQKPIKKKEEEQEPFYGQTSSQLINPKEMICDNKNSTTLYSTIIETSHKNYNKSMNPHDIPPTKSKEDLKVIQVDHREIQEADITTIRHSLHESAVDILTKGLKLIDNGQPDLNTENHKDSESILASELESQNKGTNKNTKEDSSSKVSDLTDAGKINPEMNNATGDIKYIETSLNKKMSRSTENLLNTLLDSDLTDKEEKESNSSTSNTAKIDEKQSIHAEIKREGHKFEESFPNNQNISEKVTIENQREKYSNDTIDFFDENEAITENNQDHLQIDNVSEKQHINITNSAHMYIENHNAKRNRVNIKLPKIQNGILYRSTSNTLDFCEPYEDVVELNDDFNQ